MEHRRLILIRHAHRDTEIHTLDNGLSEKGLKQVKQVVKFAQTRDLEGAVFLSSPKKRCVETITPVADQFGIKVQIEKALGEGGPIAQLDAFLDRWKYEGPELTVVSSHGDVIPMIVQKLTGGLISIKKAGWCEIELTGRECYLTLLVQKYDW
jgi:2,3-bisphosphoglycerate-dependent phosphoglycerate mutase